MPDIFSKDHSGMKKINLKWDLLATKQDGPPTSDLDTQNGSWFGKKKKIFYSQLTT